MKKQIQKLQVTREFKGAVVPMLNHLISYFQDLREKGAAPWSITRKKGNEGLHENIDNSIVDLEERRAIYLENIKKARAFLLTKG